MSEREELKPCPFCGGENLASNWHSPFIICDDCGAFGPGNADSTHEQAVKAWNTRTPEQAIAATLGGGKPTTDVAEKVEELRAESLKFPPNIRRKVNVALDGIEQAIATTLGGVGSEVCSWKLTAEQVRRCVRVGACDHGLWEAIDEDTDWQAIADELNATLGGNENRISERLRGVASDMRNIGASSMTPRELFAYWAHEVDKAADLADFLVSMNPDGLPVGLTISEDGSLLNWRGENYVRQSALGGWKLTAEQVEEIVDRNCEWYEGGEIDAQAIADELNAALGNEECDVVKSYGKHPVTNDEVVLYNCSKCGKWIGLSANYCGNCGARIRKAVKR